MTRDTQVGLNDIWKMISGGWVVCEVYPPNKAFAIFFDRDTADNFCYQLEEREEEHMHVVPVADYLLTHKD